LGFLHALSSGSGEFLPLAGGRYWRGGGSSGTTGKHGPEFGNLSVNPALLRFKAFNGGGDDFGGEFVRGHVDSPTRLTLERRDHCTSANLSPS
jgi:hypothetical protein